MANRHKDTQHCELLEKCKSKPQCGILHTRMAIIKKSPNNKCCRECGEKEPSPTTFWWECKLLVQPLWEILWRFLRKLKVELSYDLAIPFIGTYPDKTIIEKDTCTSIQKSQDMEHYSKKPRYGGNLNVHQQKTDEENEVYIYNGKLLSH